MANFPSRPLTTDIPWEALIDERHHPPSRRSLAESLVEVEAEMYADLWDQVYAELVEVAKWEWIRRTKIWDLLRWCSFRGFAVTEEHVRQLKSIYSHARLDELYFQSSSVSSMDELLAGH